MTDTPEQTRAALERYVEAATRENTRRSYRSALRHYEVDFGGKLPANPKDVARYLVSYADSLKSSTLKARLAALARWHVDQGFDDPTKNPVVKKAMKGIRTLHSHQPKQALAITIDDLTHLDRWFTAQIDAIEHQGDPRLSALLRNRAILYLGFWRALRGDELCRLQIEHVRVDANKGMSVFLNYTKGDRDAQGKEYAIPALQHCCPVRSTQQWLAHLEDTSGAIFRGIDRWGNIKDTPLNTNSLAPLMRQVFQDAGLDCAGQITSHSLKRGFANWAGQNGWDVKSLMEYVGWKDPKTAVRYLDSRMPFPGLESPIPKLTE